MRPGTSIPADHKHVAWLTVAEAIIAALEGLKLEIPKVQGKALDEAKKGGARAQGGEAALTPPLASVHRLPLKACRSQSRLTRRLLFAATLGRRGQMMAMRHQIRAMNRKALQASSGAALILGGLLLLSAP